MYLKPEDMIQLEDLEPRRIYRVRSRNLLVGVWNPKTEGFIGVRQKFGPTDRFLFTEYLYKERDGTAQAYEALDFSVAPTIALQEYDGSFCRTCEQEVYSKPGVRDGREVQCIGNYHTVPSDCPAEGTYCAYMRQNKALFDLLNPLDLQFAAERQAEHDKMYPKANA